MSLSNILFKKIIKNHCNHEKQYKNYKLYNISYFYCYKCNNIIIIDKDKLYCTYKLLFDEEDSNEKIEIDPIQVVKLMIQRQEEQNKYINDKLVINYSNNDESNNNCYQINSNIFEESEKFNNSGITNLEESEKKEKIKNIKKIASESSCTNNIFSLREKNNKFTKILFDDYIFHKYEKQRNKILLYTHKLCTKLAYNDSTFYSTLYLLDTYLSRIYSDDITEKELFLVVLGFFLISSKYIEDDIFEPELQIFCNIEKSINLSMEEIRASEVQCLTLTNYNLFLYSTYDWLNILLSNGILFENEIKDINELGNIYIYTQKLLTIVTSKIYFCKYTSMQIAFSIIQLSREKYLNKNLEISEYFFKLLISLYGVEFSDYEECYNVIKQDLNKNNVIVDEEENSNLNTKSNTNSNNNWKSKENKFNKSKDFTMDKEKRKRILNSSRRKNKFKIFLNSNKNKKYIDTENNIKSIDNKKKYKLYSSPGQINFLYQKKKNKSSEKNIEFLPNNSIGLFDNKNNKKLSLNLMTHNNSLHNTSFKSCKYIPKEQNNIMMIDSHRNDKKLVLSKKNKRSSNTLYINYIPKFIIKNNEQNINNINYINNININNEVINLYSGNKKNIIHKNVNSSLNFNFCYKINKNNNNQITNNNENKSNNYIIAKSLFTIGNSNSNQINLANNININNMNFNKKIKNDNNIHITTNQNFISINNSITNSYKNNKKIDSNNKEKYKTHLLLDISNNPTGNIIFNRNENNQILVAPEKENKSCNKYTFNESNNNININNMKKKKNTFKIHLGRKNEIKVMNTNININLNNQFSNRKFTVNFKDIVNKKLNMERENNFKTKDIQSNIKRFKSLNSNNHIIKKKNKANNKKNNEDNKSKNNKGNILIENNKESLNYKLFSNNNLNIGAFNSKLPRLKFSKNSII